MRTLFRRFPSTSFSAAVAVGVLVAAVLWRIDLFHLPDLERIGVNHVELGLITIAVLLVLPAILLDRASLRRRLNEAQLHQERRHAHAVATQLAAIVQSSDDAIIGKDLNGIITSWNRGAEQLFGYSAAEMVGVSILRLVPPERKLEEEHILERIRRGESVQHLETVRRTKDGRLLDVSITSSPIHDAAGDVIGASKVARDISERKKADEAMRLERDRAQQYLDAAEVILLALNPDGRVTLINRKGCELSGWTENELMGKVWIDVCVPEAARPRMRLRLSDLIEGDLSINESPILTKDRRERLIQWRSRILRDQDGRIIGLFSSGTDITDQHAAVEALRVTEERMRFALRSAGVGIWDMNYATGTVTWSEILEAHYGFQPGAFPGTFDAFAARIHPDDRQTLLDTIAAATPTGREFSVQNRAVHPDGTVRWLTSAGRILLDEHGQPQRAVGISIDVTERHKLEQQFYQAQKMEAVGRLAGGIAHDFNNLLTAILGYSDLLLGDLAPGDPHRRDIAEIEKAGQRAASLTRQLLAFSRKQIIQPTLVDVNALIAELRPMMARVIGEDVKIVVRPCSDLGRIKADHGQIEQVILNLAVNARDAMPKGGTLSIETASVELGESPATQHLAVKPGSYMTLTVTDTGCGMTPEVKARLFEPFFTTKEVGKGTGLGLATVHGIIGGCGGGVIVESEVGRGTSFTLYFPRAEGTDRVVAAAPVAQPRSGTQTILVVDDADSLRDLTKRILERRGYKVFVAASAEEALDVFEQNESIDVIVTDVVMPGASGPELTRQLLARRPEVKVIYMSGYTEDAIAPHGVLEPGVAFLNKPFTSDALSAKIHEVLKT